MFNKFNVSDIPKLLKVIAVYFLLNGLLLVFKPELAFINVQNEFMFAERILGVSYIILSVMFWINTDYYEENWQLYMYVLLLKLFSIVFLFVNIFTYQFSSMFFILNLVFDCLSFVTLLSVLVIIYESVFLYEESEFNPIEILKMARTNNGEKVLELSFQGPVLLVFVRHFGCTFCRETVSDISKMESEISAKGIMPIFVHMSDPSFGNEFFGQYFKNPISHISDPNKTIYKAFGLKRGTLSQLFGFQTFYRGFIAGSLYKFGIGKLEGDGLQLGGTFLIKDGKILISKPTQYAAERFSLDRFLETV